MAQYLRYVLKNIEPLRISDDSSSQSGQTVSLRYIPGTTIRGLVINRLAGSSEFEVKKKLLLSGKVRYLNACLMAEDRELMPSPKGFYEDKVQVQGRKEIQNVVIDGRFTEGFKRAALGRFCDIQGDTIVYYNVNTGSDMKIKINLKEGEKQNVFRNEYIAAGHVFVGYIAIDAEEIKEDVKKVFEQDIILGNARSAGLGKCQVLSCEYVDKLPFEEYLPKQEQENSCYMMLLSNTVMRDEKGELCGLNLSKLQKKMGVEELEIAHCSTSTVDVKGYNRVWGVKIPSAMMFEAGSVFHLTYKGSFAREKMQEICDKGIGIRTNEGFGRVLFLGQYENVKYKQQGTYNRNILQSNTAGATKEDTEVLKTIARCYYRNTLQEAMREYVADLSHKGSLAASQLGLLMSLVTAHKYEPKEAVRTLKLYFAHANEKEDKNKVHKERNSIKSLSNFVEWILETDLETILGIEKKERIMGIKREQVLSEDEYIKLKLFLLEVLVKRDNREGK